MKRKRRKLKRGRGKRRGKGGGGGGEECAEIREPCPPLVFVGEGRGREGGRGEKKEAERKSAEICK